MMALSLLAGFGLLLLGGELLVTGSVGIAHRLRISKVVIGLTLVAFATSAPELIVSVVAVLLFGWYITHIWSDCLEENSVFTCMRMLNK